MRRWIPVVLVLIALLVACGRAPSLAPQDAYEERSVERDESVSDRDAAAPAEPGAGADFGGSAQVTERLVIKNGSLDLVVKDTITAQEEIERLVDDLEGFVLTAESTRYEGDLLRINMTLKVPVESFTSAMAQLRELAIEVTRSRRSSEDVTQEYVDLESRLRALEAKAARLEELMDAAEDTEAVLEVYRELSATQEEIEQVKGRMQYLERSAAMATITVSLTPDELAQPIEVAGWRPQGTLKRAVEALIQTYQFLLKALIWIVVLVVPVLLGIGLILYLLYRLIRYFVRRRKNKRE